MVGAVQLPVIGIVSVSDYVETVDDTIGAVIWPARLIGPRVTQQRLFRARLSRRCIRRSLAR